MDKNFGFFGRYFAEISFFGEPRKENCTEISFVRFFPTFSDKCRYFSDFFRYFSEIFTVFSFCYFASKISDISPTFSDKCRYFSDFFRYFSEIFTVFSFCYFASKISKNCFWWDSNPPKMPESGTLQPPSH